MKNDKHFDIKISNKREILTYQQEYNHETGEITFSGKITIDRTTKTGKKKFYYSLINNTPIIYYYLTNPKKFMQRGFEKEEADKEIKERFNVDMNE